MSDADRIRDEFPKLARWEGWRIVVMGLVVIPALALVAVIGSRGMSPAGDLPLAGGREQVAAAIEEILASGALSNEGARAAVERHAAPHGLRSVRSKLGTDGRELYLTAQLEGGCVEAQARLGGRAWADWAWSSDACKGTGASSVNEAVTSQRLADVEASLTGTLGGFSKEHEPPYGVTDLRNALGSLSAPIDGAARYIIKPGGREAGVALRVEGRPTSSACVFGWVGPDSSVQVWTDRADFEPYGFATDSGEYVCAPDRAFTTAPIAVRQ